MALEIVVGLLGPVLEISKWVAAPIKCQLNYLCCFTANINSLENASLDEDSVNVLEGRVQSETNNLHVILHEVEQCLKDINYIKEEKRKILEDEAPNVKSDCLKVGARYSVSKRAKQTSDRMKELQEKCHEFNKAPVISHRGQIAAVQATPLGPYHKFESRKDIEEHIMTKLKDGNANMIGIWGMGGLGKTTMAKNIMNKVLKKGVFQEVVLAEVGEEVDEFKLQVEIGGQLGLELREENRVARVQKLKNRLSQAMQKTLLVLDNVWQRLKLEDIGIPCGSNWCTILITSRNKDDLIGMECSDKAIIKMEQLSEDDAWFLFKETAGSYVDRDELKPLAKKVVKECGGLPISLTTVGFALKDKNDASTWKAAARRLEQDNPNIRDYDREVYNPLKLSYDALGLEELKSIFLLCCLFPEHVDIHLEYLTYLCIGLAIFKGSLDLDDVKEEVLTWTEVLQSRSLLLGSNKRDHVKIHDVVRYVGISIAESVVGNKRHMGPSGRGECTWRFSCKRDEERSRSLFLIRNSVEKELKFGNAFSDGGIEDIYVLWIVNHSLTSLPLDLNQSLANLNTLVLDSCRGLVEIPIVGALKYLEILICRHCTIEELPQIHGLEQLKVLELTGCGKLESIRQGIISSLLSLEKLTMLGSFKKWEAKDGPLKENARLKELENLAKLTCLEIEIEDPALAAEDMQLSSKIKRFDIRIGVVSGLPPPFISHPSDTKLSLCAESQTCYGNWITMQLLRATTCLYLRGNGANNVDFTNCEKLCWLELGGCKAMKNTERTMVEENPFHRHKVSVSPFSRLQEIKISEYADTMSLFTSSIATNLVELRLLSVSHCDDMVKVIEGDEQVASGGERTLLFPNLEELELFSLRKLVSFCEWSNVELSSLRQVVIMLCPKMETFTSGSLHSPNLKIVKMNYEDIGATEDLNGTVQQYLARGKEPFNSHEFRLRRNIEEDIMTALRDREHSLIGICGMGGLGKTTMAKVIMERALVEDVFQEAVIAVVGQNVDKSKIQVEIAGSLGLMLGTETPRAARLQKLWTRLSGQRRILLVLDDVWEAIELEDFGIPRDSKGCTILLTSRNIDALHRMDVAEIFQMDVLSEDEAWFLFKKIVGTCVNDAKLNSVAKQVVKACRGLPIALKTVGTVLKDETNEFIWRESLRQLSQSGPDNPALFEDVYNHIKLSYDFLGSVHAKSLFLLCCLFPEDSDIPLEYLTYFCMGLGIFEDIRYVEEAWDLVFLLTQMLKSRSLLLDSKKIHHVRMPNVARRVCMLIAKERGYIGGKDCTWITSLELSKGMEFPNLRLIFLSRNYNSAEEEFELNNDFVEGIRNLHVLCIQNHPLTSLPHSTQPLANFKTLVMDSCRRLMSISIIGELVNLEILICRNCDSIEELPQEIKRLYRLKLLDLTDCGNLQRIGRGIISSLFCLEELKMRGSFKKWEADNKEERENAMLRELEALTNLRSLEIQVEDPALAEENIRLSSKVKIFDIRIGAVSGLLPPFISHPSNRKLSLCVEEQTRLGYWIEKQLLRETDCLYLSGNGANNLNLAESRDIRWLELGGCKTMEDTVTTSTEENPLYHHQISESVFYSLEKLSFSGYDNTMSLFTSSIAGNLVNLIILKIHHCDKMVRVIEDGEEMVNGGEKTLLFPRLKELKLKDLPKLVTFCEWKCDVVLPLLRKVVIKRCPYMKNFNLGFLSAPILETFTTELNNNLEVGGNVSFDNMKKLMIMENENPFDCHKICISLFSGLVELRVSGYHGSRNLFTSSIPKSLASLRVLIIENCDKMVKAIGNEEEEVVSGCEMTVLIFPKLEELRLEHLHKMVSFCEWKCDVEFRSLRKVVINRCPHMKNFSLGLLSAPNLETFTTDLNNNLELVFKVPFNSLKELLIMENKIPFYQNKISESLFNRVKELRVSRYHVSMGLFTYSILQKLTSLTVLTIENCDEMVKAIEDEEEMVSGGEMTRLFPNLEELRLDYLRKMVSFCEWKCGVELPSLRKVFITSCPHMKYFTSGYLYTPALGTVIVDDEDIGGTINLNYKLHHHLARAKGQEVEKRGNEIGN